jgi:hypothetical protein
MILANSIFAFASGVSNKDNQTASLPAFDIELGNVPAEYIPNSEITFDSEGVFVVTDVVQSVADSASRNTSVGIEVGGNLADDIVISRAQDALESLPIYTYDEYYVAGNGAVVQYDQEGKFIRVCGDYEYYSTIDQYKTNGVLPDGTYKGTFGEFSIITTRATKTVYGKFTTYGNYWPAISQSAYPNCNTDPVPNPPNGPSDYGDRIGTNNKKLSIGAVATRPSDNIPFGASLSVTVVAADTGSTNITKTMYKYDIMGATTPVLDIWRWDQPDWWSGKATAPDNLYFNKKYSTSLSFTSTSNYWTYTY